MAAESRAQKRSIQGSPRKMRLVLDMIRGKRVPDALGMLHFTPNHASEVAEKTLRSAIANFQQNPDNARFDVESLYVRQCWADGGASLKRVLPAPMGRAFRVRKRSNHLTIVVGDQPMQPPKQRSANGGKKSASAPKGAVAAKKPRAKKETAKAGSSVAAA